MAAPNNPYTLVHSALWAMALANPRFVAMVAEGNRIRFDSAVDRDPIKENIGSADTPEVMLVSMGVTDVNLHATSSTSQMRRRYQFFVTSGDMRINDLLYQIEWQLTCALANWKATLAPLQWNGKPFVKSANMTDASEGFQKNDQTRGIIGLSCIWACEVVFSFTTADLIADNSAE
jgi:hypothetical protein